MEDEKSLNVVDLAQYPDVRLQVGDLVRFREKFLQSYAETLKLNSVRFNQLWNSDTVFVVKKQLNEKYYILYKDGIEMNCYRNFLCKIINTTQTY